MRRYATMATAAVLFAIAFLPLARPAIGADPDLSLWATLHEAFVRGAQSGVDVVTTYGPWGLLFGGFDPRTFPLVVAADLALGLAVALAATTLPNPLLGAIALPLLIGASPSDVRCLVPIALLILLTGSDAEDPRTLPLAAGVGFISMIKLSFLAAVLIAFAAALARRRWRTAAAVVCGALGAWFLARQGVANLWPFLRNGWEIVSGYAAAASAGGRPGDLEVYFCAAGAAGFAFLAIRREVWSGLALALFEVLVLKASYVRHDDGHTPIAEGTLLALAFLLLLFVRPRIAMLAALVMIVIGAGPFVARLHGWDHAGWMRDFRAKAGGIAIAGTASTVDIYPWGGASLLVSGLRYTPRPVVQSYMAWTPRLLELDRDFVRDRGPETIVVGSLASIDGHFGLLDDSLSWPEILRRYDPTPASGIFRRRCAPRGLTAQPPLRVRLPAGQKLALPDGMLWCRVEARKTPASRLAALVTRPPTLLMRLDGQAYGVNPAVLQAGFLLSPTVETPDDLAALMLGRAMRAPRTVTFEGEGFEPEFSVAVDRLQLTPASDVSYQNLVMMFSARSSR